MYNRLSTKVEKRDMNIKPQDKTIKELLLSGRQFVIPRFQREYSWAQCCLLVIVLMMIKWK